jgi:hypothetical protein
VGLGVGLPLEDFVLPGKRPLVSLPLPLLLVLPGGTGAGLLVGLAEIDGWAETEGAGVGLGVGLPFVDFVPFCALVSPIMHAMTKAMAKEIKVEYFIFSILCG